MKIKEKFKDIPQLIKKIFEKIPLTILAIALFTMFSAIVMDTKLVNQNIFENITFFTIYFASGSFLVESILTKNDKKKIGGYIASAIIAIVFIILQNINSEAENIEYILSKILICYISTLWILSVYFLFKKSEKDFKEYILKVFINVIKTGIIYVVLSIGILIVSSIFVYLIWEDIGYTLATRLEIILLGFYYIPKLLYCLIDTDGEVHTFFKGLIKYVLTSLVIISFVIIYMYIIKILVLRDMPRNQIFRILSALFIIGMPIWTMMQYLKDESIWHKISVKLPIAFIPFILLQIYTIGIRIIDNGFTPFRYVCVALIVFEIAYIATYIIKKEKLEILLLVFNAIIIVSLIVPGINMFKISNMSQAHNLKIFKNKSDYTDEEKEKIYGAYQYLRYSEGGKEYINNILDDEDLEKIKTFSKSKLNNKISDTQYIQGDLNIEKIDIEGYSKLYFVRSNERNIDTNVKEALKSVKLETENSKYNVEADLSSQFEKYVNSYINAGTDEMKQYLKENNEFEIDNNKKFIIKSFYLRYNEATGIVENYSINGYLLEK